ncbi:MAG: hypothetical protein M9941_05135 [Anaerolineae bacterium]|nr:hypothetical protein [Anaerolineae bacterium]MCO5197120.1 hypothetical protein [Anaerolineae bacterium]
MPYWQLFYHLVWSTKRREPLPNYIAYVKRQKEHHENGTTIPILERLADGDGVLYVREHQSIYLVEDARWRDEIMAMDRLDS